MANRVVIRWSEQGLCCVEGDVVQGRPRLRRAFELKWPDDVSFSEDAQAAGQWLGQQLSQHRVAARQLVIVLPRRDIVMRQVSVPDVLEEELPELVMLQAETQLSTPLSELAIDFLPHPQLIDDGPRQVLLVTAERTRITQLRSVAESAGLNLTSVVIDPLATAEWIAQTEQQQNLDRTSASMIVVLRLGQVEISVMRGRHLLFSHVASTNETTAARLGEIRRAQGAFVERFPETVLQRAWLVSNATTDEQLTSGLSQHLGCELHVFDPQQEVTAARASASTGIVELTSTAGALLLDAEGQLATVDFLNPRKPQVLTDRSLWVKRLAIAATVAAAIGGYAWTQHRVGQIEAEIEQMSAEVEQAEDAVDRGRDALRASGVLAEWEHQQIDWLEQLDEMYHILPGRDRIYLSDYRVTTLPGEHAAQIKASGFSRSRQDVEQLYEDLDAEGYVVRPQEIAETGEDGEYPFQFQLNVSIRKQSGG